jgi:hypothetical protein
LCFAALPVIHAVDAGLNFASPDVNVGGVIKTWIFIVVATLVVMGFCWAKVRERKP